MQHLLVTSLILVGIFFLPAHSHAERFVNSYVSFEMPPNWKCDLDGTEWVCVSKYAKNVKEALIVLTAKEAGPMDSLAAFEKHLKTPKSLPDKTGKLTPSKVLSVKSRQIGGHNWVDGLHEGSEIVSFYTRYLATVKDQLAILVTFSAHKAHYTKYSNDFVKAVESLKVVASKDLVRNAGAPSAVGGGGMIGGPGVAPIVGPSATAPPPPAKTDDLMTKAVALILILGAVGILLWRRKSK